MAKAIEPTPIIIKQFYSPTTEACLSTCPCLPQAGPQAESRSASKS
ncbi:MAG: hypothetical protein IT281_08335 [Ignavibacteria bacterium]|nr:hypothetical protein [Ignavibacteria bacterium]